MLHTPTNFECSSSLCSVSENLPKYLRTSGHFQAGESPKNSTTSGNKQEMVDGTHKTSLVVSHGSNSNAGFASASGPPILQHSRQNQLESSSLGADFALILESLRSSMDRSLNHPTQMERYQHSNMLPATLQAHLARHAHLSDPQSDPSMRQQSAALLTALNSPFFPAHNLFGLAFSGSEQTAPITYNQLNSSYLQASRQAQTIALVKPEKDICTFTSCAQPPT